jgi:hypothetical protein
VKWKPHAEKNILQSKRVGSDYLRNTIFYGVVGILLFAAFGMSQLRWLGLQALIYLLIGWPCSGLPGKLFGKAGNINNAPPQNRLRVVGF